MSEPHATAHPDPCGPSTSERGNGDALTAAADGIDDLAHELAQRLAGRDLPDPCMSNDPAERRRTALATLDALDQLTHLIERAQTRAAHKAGASGATYADLGAAAGITRQSARTRFPGAVKDARPGRPKKEAPDARVALDLDPQQYVATVVEGLDHLGVRVLDSWTQEDDDQWEGLVEVQDNDTEGALGFSWHQEKGWQRLWRHGLKEPGQFSKYANAEDAAAVDAPVGEVVRLIAEAAGHNPDQAALL